MAGGDEVGGFRSKMSIMAEVDAEAGAESGVGEVDDIVTWCFGIT